MSPAFRSLLSKEWSERRRLLSWGTVLFLIYLGYCVAYELEFQNRVLASSYYTTCLMFSWMGAILLAMTTVTGEYTQRTLRFSASLPASLNQIAWTRLIGAWVTIATPILVGALVITPLLATGLFEQAGLRPWDYGMGNTLRLPDRPSLSRWEAVQFLWTLCAIAFASALYHTTLISLLGSWSRTEGTVGFIGALVALMIFPLGTIRNDFEKSGSYWAADWIPSVLPHNLAFTWSYGEWDGSSYQDLELPEFVFWPIVVNLAITAVLATIFTYRYGRRATFSRETAKVSQRRWMLQFPRLLSRLHFSGNSQRAALIWLNARQSIPLCIVGLAVAALLTFIEVSQQGMHRHIVIDFAGSLPSTTWFIGLIWATIIAISVFSAELKGGLHQFWRSRPIAPVDWFWTKYFSGLTALIVILDLLPGLIGALGTKSLYCPPTSGVGLPYFACMPLLHAMVYSLTTALICRFRRSIPVAIAAISLFFVFDQFLESIPVYPRRSTMDVFNQLEQQRREKKPVDLTSEGYPVVYGAVLLVTIGSCIFARRVSIPSTFIRASGLVLIVMLGLATTGLQAADSQIISELVERIEKRKLQLKHVHLKLSHHLHRYPALYEITSPAVQVASRHRKTPAPREPEDVRKSYEYFADGERCTWTEFDEQGEIVSQTSYDGATAKVLTLKPLRSSYGGTISPSSPRPPIPFELADQVNDKYLGFTLDNLLESKLQPTITESEIDGERLIRINFEQKRSSNEEDNPNSSSVHRVTMVFNRSRNDWPVFFQQEVFQKDGKTPALTQTVSMHDWIVSGSVSYPKQIRTEVYMAAKSEPIRLVHTVTQEYDTDLFEVDPNTPPETFDIAFPPGVAVYNYAEKKFYQGGLSGKLEEYRPMPRGLRGAVLVYHLLWISAAVGYFCRVPRNEPTLAPS